jgi:thiamine biosynthesis lipoprotein
MLRKLGLFLLGISLIACSKNPAELLYKQQFYVFGTMISISIWGVSETQAKQAVDTIEQDLQTMHKNWHAWNPSSPLMELNHAFAAGKSFEVNDPTLLHMLTISKKYYHETEGLLNPTIGKMIELWGFHQDEMPKGPPPSKEALVKLLAQNPSMDDIDINGKMVSSRNPNVYLDFGAIGKGYAVDLAIEHLQKLGINNAIVNAGGNLKAMGKRGAHPWQIGIRHPDGSAVLAAISTEQEESVITSGDYERYREFEGKHYSHILDPRIGWSAQEFASVTIVDKNAALANAASTAISVSGMKDWYRIAKQLGVKYVMLVNHAGTVYLNPAMAKRLEFDPKHPPEVKLLDEL